LEGRGVVWKSGINAVLEGIPMKLLRILMLSLLFVSAGAIAHDDDIPLTDIPLVWAPSNSIADFDPKPDLSPIIDVTAKGSSLVIYSYE
jgi:hypothetical protein